MSHLTAPTHTLADSIPLGRRITEIMAEKGPAYTIAAMAKRLDINRETLRLMLKGEREIYTFELEKIAQDLKVPVERILQSDIAEARTRVKEMIIRNDRAEQYLTLEMAHQAASVSIGLTERCIGENELSCAYANLNQMETAYQILLKIFPDSELILEKYGDPEIFLWVISSIIHTMVVFKDYVNLPKMVAKVEPHFSSNPRVGGMMNYAVAKLKEDVEGDFEEARAKYRRMLEYYSQAEAVTHARALNMAGYFEYRQGEYEASEKLIQQSVKIFRTHRDIRSQLMSMIQLGRLYIRLNQPPDAETCLMEGLSVIRSAPDIDFSDYEAHVMLLLAIATNDPVYADQIIHEKRGTISIQRIALQFLIEHAESTDDQVNRAKYAQLSKQFRGTPLDTILPFVAKGPLALVALFDLCHVHGWHLTH